LSQKFRRVADAATIVALGSSPGGVPKLQRDEVFVSKSGLDGDGHRYHGHGGPDKAVCLYAVEVIDALRAEGHPIAAGTTGENVTVRGVDWPAIVPGVRLMLGAVEVEVTEYAAPCQTIIDSFSDRRSKRISQKLHPGWSRVYARVIAEGILTLGDPVRVVEP
jgi:MOSC domain-containing protein YiiM